MVPLVMFVPVMELLSTPAFIGYQRMQLFPFWCCRSTIPSATEHPVIMILLRSVYQEASPDDLFPLQVLDHEASV